MSKPVTFAICGCGVRGLEAYAIYQKDHPESMKITAGADINPSRIALLKENYGVSCENCFNEANEMLAMPRLADVMIIATQDRQHVDHALKALDKGYHLLLEKPISPELEECKAILKKAHETNKIVIVCHVLRYTEFYSTLEAILRRGEIGKIESIDAVEYVAYWHYAHSFVRGNWRRCDESSPMILAKCCHDMDILRWMVGEECLKVSSFGSLDYFKPECAPKDAAKRCLDGCGCKGDCPYDAEKIYLLSENTGFKKSGKGWPCSVLTDEPTEQSVYDALKNGPYGRCVFHCDNDVVDHQTVNMEFANNINVTFTMTAFTHSCHRTIRVFGTNGEIEGDMEQNRIYLRKFGNPEEIIDLNVGESEFAGHGGGDFKIMEYLCKLIADGGENVLTGIDASVESHIMALAAEHSRLNGGRTITLSEFTGK